MTAENINEQAVVENVAAVESMEEHQETKAREQVTIMGDVNSYNWVGGNTGEMHVEFCTFNTKIGEETYTTTVGIKEDQTPIAVISFGAEITVDVVNYIVNHMMIITCEHSKENDALFYNKTEENTMSTERYVPIDPVLQIIGVLHSWANIARFETSAQVQ